MLTMKDAFFRGEFFYNEQLYNIQNVRSVLEDLCNRDYDEIIKAIQSFNGNFLIGIKANRHWMIFSDKIASFSLYWLYRDDELLFSDDVNFIIEQNHKFDTIGLLEAGTSRYTYGNRTIYENVKVLGPGEYLDIDCQNIQVLHSTYHVHKHFDYWNFATDGEYVVTLNQTVKRVFGRLIQRLRGRQAVLFLSGGYDSRLILQKLHEFEYKDVICISLVSRNDLDVQVAKKIANYFHYPLFTVDYTQDFWRKKSEEDFFWKHCKQISNGVVFPHYLQGMVIEDLIKKGIVKQDAVIMTGNSGDVVEGNDVFDVENFERKFSWEEIQQKICDTYCQNIINDNLVKKIILDELSIDMNKFFEKKEAEYSCEDAQDYYEYFNWYNRQCRYVTSDVRNYDDLSGNEWALPLWDDEFVAFWLKVPLKLRYKRKLYYLYVEKDNLPTANIETTWLKMRRVFLKHFRFFWPIAYAVRIFAGFNGNDMMDAVAGALSEVEKIQFVCKTWNNKTNAYSAIMWKLFKKEYGIDIFSTLLNIRREKSGS